MTGFIDPASKGRSQVDGQRLLELYRNEQLTLLPADNSVETGIFSVHSRLASGKLKVFRTCKNWQAECSVYHRDLKGKIVKKKDHLMDATRYLVQSLQMMSYQSSDGNFATTAGGSRYLTAMPPKRYNEKLRD